jgi:hypothetical protein
MTNLVMTNHMATIVTDAKLPKAQGHSWLAFDMFPTRCSLLSPSPLLSQVSLVSVTLDVQILIRRSKYKLIIKLIIQMETNLREESIKPN